MKGVFHICQCLTLPLSSLILLVSSLELLFTLQDVMPTRFVGVPRVWEKFEEGIKEKLAIRPKFVQNLAGWAMKKANDKINASEEGDIAPFGYNLANFIVLRNIKMQIGLNNCKYFAVTAAPLK
jgi:long-chain-fatty-acid--CoA ligase ACSBG